MISVFPRVLQTTRCQCTNVCVITTTQHMVVWHTKYLSCIHYLSNAQRNHTKYFGNKCLCRMKWRQLCFREGLSIHFVAGLKGFEYICLPCIFVIFDYHSIRYTTCLLDYDPWKLWNIPSKWRILVSLSKHEINRLINAFRHGLHDNLHMEGGVGIYSLADDQ